MIATALSDRVKALAIAGDFQPFSRPHPGAGSIDRFAIEHPLLPRLGYFLDEPESLPFDIHHLLALSAPRPVLMIQPARSPGADLQDVRQSVSKARQVYALLNANERLELQTPTDYNHLPPDRVVKMRDWLVQFILK